MAIGFVTVFSYTTSPIYAEWGDTPDSPIFQIIGKYWAQGDIPYRDLWDLKGPYIFLMNAIGYGLTGTRLGVYAVQTVCMVLTLLCIYKMFRTHFHPGKSLAMTGGSLLPLSYIYEGGNLTEEYLLPLLSLSFLFFLRWIDGVEEHRRMEHPPLHAALYGMVLGLALMSRLTNALPSCAATGVVAIFLICNRQFKNLWLNACAFLLGLACSSLPFIDWFSCHHALETMWNATFLYAIEYASHAEKDIMASGIHYFFLSYFSSFLLVAVCLWRSVCQRELTVRTWLWLMSAGVPLVWFCQGNGFGHYGMTVLPLFAIAMTEITLLRLRPVAVGVVGIMLVACLGKVRYMYMIHDKRNVRVSACSSFLKSVPGINYSSFVAYNCDPNIYLALDIHPANAFFALQDFAIGRNSMLRSDIVSSFRMRQPEWILLKREEDEAPAIQPILEESYTIAAVGKSGNPLILYRKR